jgi:hypothetical protein
VKGWVPGHAFELVVNFIASSVCHFCCPANKMVFEDSLMKLVVDIGGKKLEYVYLG